MIVQETDVVIKVDVNDPLQLLRSYVDGCGHRVDFRDEHPLREQYCPETTYEIDIFHRKGLSLFGGAQFILCPEIVGIILRAFYPVNTITYAYSHRQRDKIRKDFRRFLDRQEIPFTITKKSQYDY